MTRKKITVCAVMLALMALSCSKDEVPELPQLPEASGSAALEGSSARVEPGVRQAPEVRQAPPLPSRAQANDEDVLSEEQVEELRAKLGIAPPPALMVGDLLTRADVREIGRFSGALAETTLEGIPPTTRYNAVRIAADDGYGFALQLWRVDELRQLAPRFNRIKDTYITTAPETAPVGDESFSADFQGIRHYAFMHRASRSVAIVTCSSQLCDAAQIRALAARVESRL